eukprot:3241134-Pyramimonas_sp.AAC.1
MRIGRPSQHLPGDLLAEVARHVASLRADEEEPEGPPGSLSAEGGRGSEGARRRSGVVGR